MKKIILSLMVVLFLFACDLEKEKEEKEDIITMIQVPVPKDGIIFPTGKTDSGSEMIKYAYKISETEVSYSLWEKVYFWAINNGYKFQNPGRDGGDDSVSNDMPSTPVAGKDEVHPVTQISWKDAIVFCNALTEYEKETNSVELEVCYYGKKLLSKDSILRDSTDESIATTVFIDSNAKGYRLPNQNEWECAARWIGVRKLNPNTVSTNNNGIEYWWTKGNSTSGATEDTLIAAAAMANFDTKKTKPLKSLTYNGLKLYDMSGNVAEFCFDSKDDKKIIKGGSCFDEKKEDVAISHFALIGASEKQDYTGIRLVLPWIEFN